MPGGRSGRQGVLAVGLLALLVVAGPAPAAGTGTRTALSSEDGHRLVRELISGDPPARRRAARRLTGAGDGSLVPAIVDGLFFVPDRERDPVLEVLAALTGEQRGRRYYDWVELVGARGDLAPKEGYAGWKGSLLARIDARFAELIHDRVVTRIRLEEVVWGGVRFEGIPALDRPEHVVAAEATYLADDEIVFGVAAGGEHRAYPRRILSWHEMANDVVGGEPVTLSYCTLCGSAVLYSGRLGDRDLTFGTSGLLYRSNKLMVDRATGTLWSNLSGEAVVGPLAAGEPVATLATLPLTLTTWGEWRSRHPETTALALDPERGRRFGFDYSPGAADRARFGVSFPVWQKSDRLDPQTEVYTLRAGAVPKAYVLDRVTAEGVVNDTVGGTPLVLVSDPRSGAVRVYRRGEHTFRRAEGGGLADEAGREWRLSEEALHPPQGAAGLSALPRHPGHNAFWFGWFGFYPQTEVFD